jgi:hypothetical protein
MHDIDLAGTAVGELKEKVKSGEDPQAQRLFLIFLPQFLPSDMASKPAWKAYRNADLGRGMPGTMQGLLLTT